MRIDPKLAIPAITRDGREAPTAAKAGDTAAGGAVVELSAAAAASAEGAPAASITARLRTIRAMVDSGDYPVDLDVLATRIVEDELRRARRSRRRSSTTSSGERADDHERPLARMFPRAR